MFYLILPLGYFLQKHITAGSFSVETFYYWIVSYSILFNHANMSTVGIVFGLLLLVPI